MDKAKQRKIKKEIIRIIQTACCGDWSGAVTGAGDATQSIVDYLVDEGLLVEGNTDRDLKQDCYNCGHFNVCDDGDGHIDEWCELSEDYESHSGGCDKWIPMPND